MPLKGYSLEHWTERFFLDLLGISPKSPILDEKGNVLRPFRVPASGALSSLKGDVIVPNFLNRSLVVECKRRKEKTKKRGHQFSLRYDWLRKVSEEAKDSTPVFVFSLTRLKGKYFVFREDDFNQLFKIESNVFEMQTDKRAIVLSKKDLSKKVLKIVFNFGQNCFFSYVIVESSVLKALYEEKRGHSQENRGD